MNYGKYTIKFIPTYSADTDVQMLADYIVALLKHDKPSNELRAVCLEQLADFLGPSMFTMLIIHTSLMVRCIYIIYIIYMQILVHLWSNFFTFFPLWTIILSLSKQLSRNCNRSRNNSSLLDGRHLIIIAIIIILIIAIIITIIAIIITTIAIIM